MPMSPTLKRALESDAQAACRLIHESIIAGCRADHGADAMVLSRWLEPITPDQVRSWFAWPAHRALVATLDGEMAGIGMLARPGKLALLYVAPAMQRKGLGALLLQRLCGQVASSRPRTLHVHSTLSAQGFFARQGFSAVGECPAAHGAMIVMQKKLGVQTYPGAKPCRCG